MLSPSEDDSVMFPDMEGGAVGSAPSNDVPFWAGSATQDTPAYSNLSSPAYFAPEGVDPNELPLLEELGIYPDHIMKRTLMVLHPFTREAPPDFLDDRDCVGPLMFCLLLGFALLLSGKVHFGFIYGIGSFGCIGLYMLLNMMSAEALDVYQTVSVLGYCLLPISLLAVLGVVLQLNGVMGYVMAAGVIGWCTRSATLIFVTALHMEQQTYLIAYPVALFYVSFALLSIF